MSSRLIRLSAPLLPLAVWTRMPKLDAWSWATVGIVPVRE